MARRKILYNKNNNKINFKNNYNYNKINKMKLMLGEINLNNYSNNNRMKMNAGEMNLNNYSNNNRMKMNAGEIKILIKINKICRNKMNNIEMKKFKKMNHYLKKRYI
jgi:hypothetical protein